MSYTIHPVVAWLTRNGRWRIRPLKAALVAQRAYVRVPDGMDVDLAVEILYRSQAGPEVQYGRE